MAPPPNARSHGETAHEAAHRELLAAHQPETIRRRLDAGAQHSYLKDFVYGAIDGAVTTFAVVSGVAGAGLSPGVLVVLGVANLVGDGFSMAAGNYLGTQAEVQQRDRLRRQEERHIDLVPEGEREELRQIFAAYGIEEPALGQAVATVTADRQRWVDVMLREEYGITGVHARPIVAALVTFAAFGVVGLIPLLPFLANLLRGDVVPTPFAVSTGLTGTAFFLVGAFKSRFVDEHWLRAGLTTLLVGGLAAGLAYLLGAALHGVVA